MLSHSASAQSSDQLCINNMVDVDLKTVALYEVDTPTGIHFVHGPEAGSCPAANDVCQQRARLVKGNQVVVISRFGDYACAIYVAARKGKAIATSGWLPLSALKTIEPSPHWAGHWISDDSDATIDVVAKDDAKIGIDGNATWNSNPIDAQSGQFGAVISPQGAFVSFTDGDNIKTAYANSACTIKAAQLGPYLVITDNHNCGGSNVTFSSVYVRK